MRDKIEAWRTKDKLNTTQISLKLKALGEPISRRALDNHFDEHFDVQAEVREQYNKSQAALQDAAEERISEIQMLDDVALEKYRLHQKLTSILSNQVAGLEAPKDPKGSKEPIELPKLPQAWVTLYIGCAAEIRQALKTKQELLGEDGNHKKAEAMQSWVDLMLEDE